MSPKAQPSNVNADAYSIKEIAADYDLPTWKARRMNIDLNHMNSDHSATVILRD